VGKLIVIVGNSGVGKTTFAQQLCHLGSFSTGLEQHAERPFQALFSQDLPRYALANQMDYLLFRAEQERAIRQGELTGVMDGGLDQDFFVFTRLFYRRGYLTDADYRLCERMYRFIRQGLPPPDLIIRLVAPLDVIAARYARRSRGLEIAKIEDLEEMEHLLDDWLGAVTDSPILTVDASDDDPGYVRVLVEVGLALNYHLNNR
jgi:deoxyadenosine/deoxycytidine kinase